MPPKIVNTYDPVKHETVWTITIPDFEYVALNFTEQDKARIFECGRRGDSIVHQLVGLAIILKKLEEQSPLTQYLVWKT